MSNMQIIKTYGSVSGNIIKADVVIVLGDVKGNVSHCNNVVIMDDVKGKVHNCNTVLGTLKPSKSEYEKIINEWKEKF